MQPTRLCMEGGCSQVTNRSVLDLRRSSMRGYSIDAKCAEPSVTLVLAICPQPSCLKFELSPTSAGPICYALALSVSNGLLMY